MLRPQSVIRRKSFCRQTRNSSYKIKRYPEQYTNTELCSVGVPCGASKTVALVLLVKLLVDRHQLGLGAWLDVVPWGGVVLAVPDDVGSSCKAAQIPVGGGGE